MKRTILFLFCLFCLNSAFAETFEVGGFMYSTIPDTKNVEFIPKDFLNAYSGDIVIPSSVSYEGTSYTVTAIGEWAFLSSSGLTSITIPSSVTTIGNRAFSNCSGLKSITIPSSVSSIGDGAFLGCSGLKSITIPNSVTSIGDYAFYQCTGLKKATIPSSVTSIGGDAFSGCFGINDIEVDVDNPNYISVEGVVYNKQKTALIAYPSVRSGEFVIPSSVTSIGNGSFSGSSLTGITIPSSVSAIGDEAFSGCSGLTSITIPSSVTAIGDEAFSGCKGLTSITIPSSVTSIGDGAFSRCSGLTSITIPSSVTAIGDEAFSGCWRLTGITIPSKVTSIGACAFSGCSGLTSITIPSSVTSIGGDAFSCCFGINDIEVDVDNPNYTSVEGVVYNKQKTALIAYPSGRSGEFVIPSSVTSIASSTFAGCDRLSSITIPSSVTSIGEYALTSCSNLTSIYALGETPAVVEKGNFDGLGIGESYTTKCTLYVPKGSEKLYRATLFWKDFQNIVELDVTSVK